MIIKLVIVVALLACIGLFFIEGPDGEPLMTLDRLVAKTRNEPVTVLMPPESVTVYKWQDENGVWQFSSDPADAEGAEAMVLDGQINTIPLLPEVTETIESSPPGISSEGVAALPSGLTTVAPEKIAEMIEQVEALQGTIEEKQSRLDNALGEQ